MRPLPPRFILPSTECNLLYATYSTSVATQSEATCIEIFREHLQAYLDSFDSDMQGLAEVKGSTPMPDKKARGREEDAEDGEIKHQGDDEAAGKEVRADDMQL